MISKGLSLIPVLVLILIQGSPSTVIGERSTDPPKQSVDIIEIEIEEEEVRLDIGFNGTNLAILHCTATLLTNLGLLIDYADVYIEPVYSDPLKVVVEDDDFRLTPEDPVHEFIVNISTIPGTSASLKPIVTIDGTARTSRGTTTGVNDDSVNVVILPYYGSILEFATPMGSVSAGDKRTFQLVIENNGNIGEHFILKVDDPGSLVSDGISVTFKEARVYVEEGGTKNVDVEVRVDSKTDRGAYVIRVVCYPESTGPGSDQESAASLTLNVDKGFIDAFEGFFKSPAYFWGTLIVLIIVLILAGYGIYRLKQHLEWKRTLRRIRETNLEQRRAEEGSGP
ncbi:MAG: choice-of-anchor T family protein [Thermoplasmatota archaeon]